MSTEQRNKHDAPDLKIATWNVLTLLQAGKMQEVANQMIKNQLDIIALQEIRWQGQGKIDKKDFSLIYSGPKDKTGQFGTGFLINKTVRGSIMEYQTVSDKICKIRLKGKFRNITIVSIHAPTKEKSEEIKETFYESLDEVLSQVQKYDQILVIGDFNAQVGSMESQSDVAGKFTVHDYNNNNGDYMAEFAARNKLFIRSTSFQHKKIHLGTWKVRGSNQVNQIDHVLVSKRHISSVLDVRACRGFNCDSDHYLVKAIIREKLSTVQTLKKNKQTKWDTTELKKDVEVRRAYQEALSERLHISPNISVEEKWKLTRTAITNAAEKTVSKQKKGRNMNWYDQECKDLVERKNQARQVMLQRNTRNAKETYKNLRRESKRIMKRKKQENLRREMKEIEDLNKEGETRKFYVAMKKMRNEFQPKISGCRNDRGVVDLDERNTINKWTQYFKELLNPDNVEPLRSETQEHETTPQNRQADDNEEEDAPNITEVKKAIQRLKNNRAPGEDGIVAELIKYGGEELENAITEIIKDIWMKEVMPDSWNTGVICPIHKKGDKSKCENYRGITLLNTAYKVLTIIINDRIKTVTNEKIGEYQCGFRTERGTTDQLFVVRQMMEKCYEYDIDLHILFIDFKQAFDSLDRQKLKQAMIELQVTPKMINLAMMTMNNSKALVKVDNTLGDPFDINAGVKQGDSLSTTLFIIALHKAIKPIDQRGTIFTKTTQLCAYADDIGVIARTKERLVEIFKQIEENGKELGRVVNENKTMYMKISASEDRRTVQNLTIGERSFKAVTEFKYLGEIVNNIGKTSSAIKERIRSGNRAYFANIKLLKNKLISRKTKLKIYKTLIRPIITFGSENWTMTQDDQNRLRIFERKIIRRIYGAIRLSEEEWRIRNNREIDEILNQEDVVRFIKSQRLRWFGHVQRMEEHRMPKKIMNARVYGTRRRGRPRLRWMDQVLEDLRTMRVTGWGTSVKNRLAWRQIVEEAKAHFTPVGMVSIPRLPQFSG
uniref:Craniofacial development protein 2 n=1 Tax=Cacopsylla melanoneura TaxID=428564 RepID=A0A8D9B4S3_9HEMI